MKFSSNIDYSHSEYKNNYINELPNTLNKQKNNKTFSSFKSLNDDILLPIEVDTYLNVNALT
jgi:hypothetical protein